MTDLAELGLAIRSDGVVVAKDRLKDFSKEAQRAETMTDRLIKKALQLVGAYATWRVAEAIVRKFITSTAEAERVQRQLEQAVRSTGGAAGFTARQLLQTASSLQKVTSYGDEAIASSEALMLTFMNIGHDVFPEATKAILNTATAMGTDLQSATLQVGKALNNPIEGMAALTRIGITFSASQKQVIKDLVETNHVADAQRVILGELEKKFGGSAQAARHTLGGALSALQEAFGDLFESTGPMSKALRDSIEKLIQKFQDPKFIEAIQGFGATIFNMIAIILNGVQKIWEALKSFFEWLDSKSTGKMSVSSMTSEIESLNRAIEKTTSKVNDPNPLADHGGWFGSTFGAQEGLNNLIKRRDLLQAELSKRNDPTQFDINATFDTLAGMPQIDMFNMGKGFGKGGGGMGPTEEQIAEMERASAAYDKLTASAKQQIAANQLQMKTVGMTAEEVARLTYEQTLLNQAANDNIKLTPEQTAELKALAAEMARTEEQAKRLTEAYEFGRDMFRSFFSDIKSELMNGASVWEAFGNAVSNVLDRLANKALEFLADQAFSAIFGAMGGDATGGLFGSLFGIPNAKGNAFNNGIHGYANSVVDKPTFFKFAHGVGMMGEAGPEAIMPLRRDANGRLGVAAANSNGPVINVQIIKGADEDRVESTTNSDGSIDIKAFIVDTTAQAATTRGNSLNRALRAGNGALVGR